MIGNHVYGFRRTWGSNPHLSATEKHFFGSAFFNLILNSLPFLCAVYIRVEGVMLCSDVNLIVYGIKINNLIRKIC